VARVFAMTLSKNRDKQNLGRTKTGFIGMSVHFIKAVKACLSEPASACYAFVPARFIYSWWRLFLLKIGD